MRTTMSFGLRSNSVCDASPMLSSVPGRKLSMNIAAEGTKRSNRSRASGLRNSRPRLFLLRA
jgi:hypothetical protein